MHDNGSGALHTGRSFIYPRCPSFVFRNTLFIDGDRPHMCGKCSSCKADTWREASVFNSVGRHDGSLFQRYALWSWRAPRSRRPAAFVQFAMSSCPTGEQPVLAWGGGWWWRQARRSEENFKGASSEGMMKMPGFEQTSDLPLASRW